MDRPEFLTSPGSSGISSVHVARAGARRRARSAVRPVFAGRGALRDGDGNGAILGLDASGDLQWNSDSEAVPATSLNSRLPIAIENILSKALEKDKDLRYQTAAELRADLKRLKRDLELQRRAGPDKSDSGKPAWRLPQAKC